MKNNPYSIVLFLLGLYIYGFMSMNQISEKQFFNEYLGNTTQIDIYNHQNAHLFFNNETKATHFVRLSNNNTQFVDQLGEYDFPVLHKVSYVNKIVETVLMMLFFALLINSRGLLSGMSTSIFSEDKISTCLKDVAGLEHQKQEVFEFVDFLKNREKYIEAGARMPRGALFHGPPGTGKTLLARAVAGECNISFLSVAGPDFSEMYVGVGAARVRDLFVKARKKAPCIIFIDEIDALARARTNHSSRGGSRERESTLNRFLIELDGFEENDKVLIFGATNRIDMLDKALLRPGRFDRKIQFELPERGGREKIFKHYFKKMELSENIEKMANHLSKQSFGLSCADIANICNEASILSVRQNKDKVTQKILETAVDNILLGHEKKTFRLSDKERNIVAYHESGHTVMSYLLTHVKPPIKVSIMPRGKSALGFSQTEVSETKLKSKQELLERICVLLGGRVAEKIFCKDITTGASDDIQKLTEVAYQYVSIFGMEDHFPAFHYDRSKDNYGDALRNKIDKAVLNIIKTCYKRTEDTLTKHKSLIKKMAEELLQKETLNQEEIVALFNS